MNKSGIQIRWITTCCFEVVLPNGKVIVFDPWDGSVPEGSRMPAEDTGFTKDEFTGADYIFLSHSHGDHIWDAKYILEKYRKDTYGGQVFMPALSAKIMCDQLDIAYRDAVPMFPGETLDLDDIIVTCHKCRHYGDAGSPKGTQPSVARKRLLETGGDPDEAFMSNMGSIEEMDLSVTVKENNFRFMVLGGRIYRFYNIYDYCKTFNPEFVIRQVSPGFAPADYAEIVEKYHAPIVFPSHHDSHKLEQKRNTTYEEYFGEVNRILQEKDSCTRVVNIERLKWYHIGTTISEV